MRAGTHAPTTMVLQRGKERDPLKEERDLQWANDLMGTIGTTETDEASLYTGLTAIERSGWPAGRLAGAEVREHLSVVKLYRAACYRGFNDWVIKGRPPLPFAPLTLPAREMHTALRAAEKAIATMAAALRTWILDATVQQLLKKSPEIIGEWDETLRELELGVSVVGSTVALGALLHGNPVLGFASGATVFVVKRLLQGIREDLVRQAIAKDPSLIDKHLGRGYEKQKARAGTADNATEGISQLINVTDSLDLIDYAVSVAGDTLSSLSAFVEMIAPEVGWTVWTVGTALGSGRGIMALSRGPAPLDLIEKTRSLGEKVNMVAAADWAFGKGGVSGLAAIEPTPAELYLVSVRGQRVAIGWTELYRDFPQPPKERANLAPKLVTLSSGKSGKDKGKDKA